jgi:mono/diheme cytochrome c family protein
MFPGNGAMRRPGRSAALLLALLVSATVACRAPQKMASQPRHDPLEESTFFDDGSSARPPVPGTVSRGSLRHDELLYTGRRGGQLVDAMPFPATREVLERGRQRYDIFCAPCHAQTGMGDGMIVRRGYRRPPSLHADQMLEKTLGHYFDVMTHGFGAMPPYASQIPVNDRWAIAAYIRVLQFSQSATMAEVPPDQRAGLAAAGATR